MIISLLMNNNRKYWSFVIISDQKEVLVVINEQWSLIIINDE